VFLHTDLCPENVVYLNGEMRVVDNGSWSIGPAVYDVARTWWRWPMQPAGRRSFRDAYGPLDPSLPFWIVVAAVGSTLYRTGGRADIAEAAHARLAALVSLVGSSTVDLFDAAIP
jgi:thiamine kinase-like enzyme